MEKPISNIRLVLTFDAGAPIGISELSRSFEATAALYKSTLPKYLPKEADIDLYITSINNNCISVEVIDFIQQVVAVWDTAAALNNFADRIIALIEHFWNIGRAGSVSQKDIKHSKRETEDFSKLFEVIKDNQDAGFGIKAIEYKEGEDGAKELRTDFFPKDKILEAREGARLALEEIKKFTETPKNNVHLRFTQANVGKPKRKGHTDFRGIIKEISKTDLPVFMSEDDSNKIKKLMNAGELNLTPETYLVDVCVKRNRNGKLQSYEIKKWRDRISNDDS